MKLYGHSISPRYRRVAFAAAEFNVPLELIELNIAGGENRTPEYLARNPMGKIPTFEDDDGWSLYESYAIVTHLAEKFPERGLFPTTLRGRAEAMRWMFWGASHLDPSIVPLVVNKLLNPMRGQPTDATAVANAERDLARYLPVLEAQLSKGPWLLGDAFSLVDVALGSSIDALLHPKLAFDRDRSPKAAEWVERLRQRPSWSVLNKR